MWENSTQLSKNSLVPEAGTLPGSIAHRASLSEQQDQGCYRLPLKAGAPCIQ